MLLSDLIQLLGLSLNQNEAIIVFEKLGWPTRISVSDKGDRYFEFSNLGFTITHYASCDAFVSLHFHFQTRMVRDGFMQAYSGNLIGEIRAEDKPAEVKRKLDWTLIFETDLEKTTHQVCDSNDCSEEQPYFLKYYERPIQATFHFITVGSGLKSLRLDWMPNAKHRGRG